MGNERGLQFANWLDTTFGPVAGGWILMGLLAAMCCLSSAAAIHTIRYFLPDEGDR